MHPTLHVLHFLALHKYPFLLVGLFFAAESVLFLGIYLAIIGVMNIWVVALLALLAFIGSEIVWYLVGTLVTYHDLRCLPLFKKHSSKIDTMEHFFSKHAYKAIVYSKFIYGTRTPVEILAGVHRLDFKKYVAVNVLCSVVIIGVFVVVGQTVGHNIERFRYVAHSVERLFTFVAILIVIIHIAVNKYLVKKMQTNKK